MDPVYERVYRAVSEEEYQQILATGTFKIVPQGCEGKHLQTLPKALGALEKHYLAPDDSRLWKRMYLRKYRAYIDGQTGTVSDLPGFST